MSAPGDETDFDITVCHDSPESACASVEPRTNVTFKKRLCSFCPADPAARRYKVCAPHFRVLTPRCAARFDQKRSARWPRTNCIDYTPYFTYKVQPGPSLEETSTH